MITPIDVIDSAVKIGLGAIISGLAAYWLTKANHVKTMERDRAQRKRELLEGIARQVARLDETGLTYWQAVFDWLGTPTDEPISETTRAELTGLEREFRVVHKEFTNVEAFLWLLGEVKCCELFRVYAKIVFGYPLDDVISRKITIDRLEADRKVLREERTEFFAELHNVYRKL